jgi:hypothetical protein
VSRSIGESEFGSASSADKPEPIIFPERLPPMAGLAYQRVSGLVSEKAIRREIKVYPDLKDPLLRGFYRSNPSNPSKT